MNIRDFDLELRALTKEDIAIRPFVCDGSPLECRVFIVGFNPASSVPFWPFWQPPRGFDKASWDAEYLRIKGAWSPTRLRINRLSCALIPYASCLETNIYSYPSRDEKSLTASRRDTRVFEFLLEAVRPAVVLFHGEKATSFGKSLDEHSFHIKAGKHLRFWRYEAVDAAAEEISSWLKQKAGG